MKPFMWNLKINVIWGRSQKSEVNLANRSRLVTGWLISWWWNPENGNNGSCQGIIEQGIQFATASAMLKKCCRTRSLSIAQVFVLFRTELCVIWCQQRCGVTFFLSDWAACFCDLKINSLKTMCFRVSDDECERRWRGLKRTNRWVKRLCWMYSSSRVVMRTWHI